MRLVRNAVGALLALLLADLLVLLVTGERTLLPFAARGPVAVSLRLGAVAILGVLRWRTLAEPGRATSWSRLALVGLLLPTLGQFQLGGARLSGVDAISYYALLRSTVVDRDFELSNEYAHYEMLERPDLSMPTRTGHRRSIYSVGPAIAWTPFFLVGDTAAHLEQRVVGSPVDLSGYGRHHVNAVALGSLLYGFAAVLLIHGLLRRHFAEGVALAATVLVWWATFFHWYLVVQPLYSHSVSTAAAAYALWLWDRDRGRRSLPRLFYLSLVIGIAMSIRWQNGVLLVLPGQEIAIGLWRERALGLALLARRALACAGTLSAGAALGALPQMLAWKAIYDEWVLRYPPHGADFLRLDHPWLLETLFSSRHGLLSWTPVLWLGYLGFWPLLRGRARLGLPLLLPLIVMSYVNLCAGDWWAGGSFSNRRFDSVLPMLALGITASLERLVAVLRDRGGLGVALLAGPLLTWNLLLVEQTRRGLVPRHDTAAFSTLAGNASRIVAEAVGFPTTWPASWVFALRHRLSPDRFDRLVGKYLFYRQSSLGGHIEIGAPGDDLLLGEGWGPIEGAQGERVRRISSRGRLLIPLDVPETLGVTLRAVAGGSAASEARVLVNGREVLRQGVGSTWGELSAVVPSRFWRRELNDLEIETSGDLLVDQVRVTREP